MVVAEAKAKEDEKIPREYPNSLPRGFVPLSQNPLVRWSNAKGRPVQSDGINDVRDYTAYLKKNLGIIEKNFKGNGNETIAEVRRMEEAIIRVWNLAEKRPDKIRLNDWVSALNTIGKVVADNNASGHSSRSYAWQAAMMILGNTRLLQDKTMERNPDAPTLETTIMLGEKMNASEYSKDITLAATRAFDAIIKAHPEYVKGLEEAAAETTNPFIYDYAKSELSYLESKSKGNKKGKK